MISLRHAISCLLLAAATPASARYRVRLRTPLGIAFEEVEPGKACGVVVADLVDGGNAEHDGRIWGGDRLLSTSAVVLGGDSALLTVGGGRQFTNWKRELIPATAMGFEEIETTANQSTGDDDDDRGRTSPVGRLHEDDAVAYLRCFV